MLMSKTTAEEFYMNEELAGDDANVISIGTEENLPLSIFESKNQIKDDVN